MKYDVNGEKYSTAEEAQAYYASLPIAVLHKCYHDEPEPQACELIAKKGVDSDV